MTNEVSRFQFTEAMRAMAGSVYDFHSRFDVKPITEEILADRLVYLETVFKRLDFLTEEVGEFIREVNKGDNVEASLEAADILYVALGTLLCFDKAGVEAIYRTSTKNDRKLPGTFLADPTSGKIRKIPNDT